MSNVNVISSERILQLGSAFWASKALLSAVELGLFTELAAAGPLDAAALRTRLGLHGRGAHDFLDALVSVNMLQRLDDGRYANTAETELYLDRQKPSYIGGILEMANRRLYPFWGRLTEALRTGLPQNEIRDGEDLFAAIYADPANLEGFLRAMTGISLMTARAISTAFPWHKYGTFADVGCAQGALPAEIAREHPNLLGYGFDLPAVAPVFDHYVAEHRLSGRVSFFPGDFFKDPLPEVDVLVMGHILHDWSLEEKKLLLRKAYDALPAGGSLIVYDAMIDDERRQNTFGLLMSLNMLIETTAGFDYTGAECMGWMRDAGFKDVRVEPLHGPYSMVVGVK
jgi:SAM-dependent methyltransferase